MTSPRVLAVVVSHDGAEWLPEVLDALDKQTYRDLEVVAVDNGSVDGSRELLRERLGDGHVLISDADLGFPAAVNFVLDSAIAIECDADWLLFVHDDLVLEPEAAERLVEHAKADARLAAVGPKLLQYDNPHLLQQVGVSIDLTGRTDTGLEPDEVDQGQRDQPRPVLYVSTAGMLVRRDVFEGLGRFDPRYHAFREDLDLCWRAWLEGYEVEVAPSAAGRHVRAVSNFERLGRTAFPGPRYYAERNTLATLIKCYAGPRLALVLPLFFLVGIAKVLGFVATRRLGDATQTMRAWGWNLFHLRTTLRLREKIQQQRTRSDAELRGLFARVVPRAWAYAEAMADWLAGGPGEIPAPEAADIDERRTASGPAPVRLVAQHPVAAVGTLLALLTLIGGFQLLRPGAVHGGAFAAWPDSARAFLSSYASAWNEASGLGSAVPASPAQALLGLLQMLTLGNEWLASRLMLLGALPAAWIVALRAGLLVTPRRLPRLAGATAFVLSPPALAAVATGNLGGMATLVLLPALALASARLARSGEQQTSAWRSTVGAALIAALLIAFEPPAALPIGVVAVAGLVAVTLRPTAVEERRAAALRLVAAVAGTFLLLLPWSLTFIGSGSPLFAGFHDHVTATGSFLDWLFLSPDLPGFPGVIAGAGFVAAGLLGLFVAYGRRPLLVAGLWTGVLLGVFGAWLLGRPEVDVAVWPALPLLVAAVGFAGLLTVALSTAGDFLAEHAFGWRQVLTGMGTGVVLVGLVAGGAFLATDAWDGYSIDRPSLPAFVTAEQDVPGPYRVLVLSEEDGTVVWDVTGPEGPTMTSFGTPTGGDFAAVIDEAVSDVVGSVSPAAAARLGLANILYVYVPEGGRSPDIETALADQLDLEPQSVESGLVYRVRRWAPRAAFVSARSALAESRKGELPPEAEPQSFAHVADDRFVGEVPEPGAVLLAEAAHPGWVAELDGRELPKRTSFGLTRFPARDAGERATVSFEGQAARTAAIVFEAFVAVLAISLLLRPPQFARDEYGK